jgi:hypothetical protein
MAETVVVVPGTSASLSGSPNHGCELSPGARTRDSARDECSPSAPGVAGTARRESHATRVAATLLCTGHRGAEVLPARRCPVSGRLVHHRPAVRERRLAGPGWMAAGRAAGGYTGPASRRLMRASCTAARTTTSRRSTATCGGVGSPPGAVSSSTSVGPAPRGGRMHRRRLLSCKRLVLHQALTATTVTALARLASTPHLHSHLPGFFGGFTKETTRWLLVPYQHADRLGSPGWLHQVRRRRSSSPEAVGNSRHRPRIAPNGRDALPHLVVKFVV